MQRELTEREREAALAMIRHAISFPGEEEWTGLTEVQKQAWEPPPAITAAQRSRWEEELSRAVVTRECDCGTCPTIGLQPSERTDAAPDSPTTRIVLEADAENALVLLFVDDDRPTCLELAPVREDRRLWSEFPAAGELSF